MQHSTSSILSVCDHIFNPQLCHQIARQSGFIQRSSSKIDGHELLKTSILPSPGLSEDSLHGLCERMKEFNPHASISASALAQRINTTAAVNFIKLAFGKILEATQAIFIRENPLFEGIFKIFKNIYIQDSTVMEINKKLSRFFPGTKRGGRKGKLSCKSQMKIDLIYNITNGQITDTKIYKGKQPDQASSIKILPILKKGDLSVRDLGYFKLDIFEKIAKIGAFFLSRFPPHVKIYLKPNDQNHIDLASHLRKHYEKKSVIDLNVWIGEERLEVRLLAYKVPKQVEVQRRRQANKKAKEMGRKLSKAKLDLLGWSLFITNIGAEMVSCEAIGTVYRLRWEIELIFKTWKSELKIQILKGICLHRILYLIWSRLCMVVLLAYISSGFLTLAKKMFEGELSEVKLIRYLLRNAVLAKAVQTQALKELETNIIQDIPRRLLKDKRKRTTMRERACMLEPYYEWAENF